MREPPIRVRLIGNPLVAIPIYGLSGLALYGWSQEPGAFIIGIPAIFCAVWTFNAQKIMGRYRDWHRAWEAMAEPKPRRPVMPRLVAGLIAALVIGAFVLSESGMGQEVASALAGVLVLGTALAAIAVALLALMKRLRSRKRTRAVTDPRDCVAVLVTRPIVLVPDLKDAYNALPEHCRQAINGGRQ